MRGCVIFNPAARGHRARRFRAMLRADAADFDLQITDGPGHAIELAAKACQRGCETVVAAGGDGTLSEVVEGMARVAGALERARLGIVPLGTINVFARELGLPRRPSGAWAVIRAGHVRRVDLPAVEVTVAGQRRLRRFVQLAGAGLDSRAVARVNERWKKCLGPLAYVLAGLQAMTGPQPRVTARIGERTCTGTLVLVGNGARYGGEVRMFPGARLDDGRLHMRVFPRVTVWTLARFAGAWLTGGAVGRRAALSLQAEALEIASTEPLPVEVDGDNVGATPGRFTICPSGLRVLAP